MEDSAEKLKDLKCPNCGKTHFTVPVAAKMEIRITRKLDKMGVREFKVDGDVTLVCMSCMRGFRPGWEQAMDIDDYIADKFELGYSNKGDGLE